MFQAVCCDDHIHCCPHDTVCNQQAQTCDSQSGGRPPLRWVEKVSALTSEGQGEQCDEQRSCPEGSTCCKKASGQWACCPLPQVSAGGASARRDSPDSPPFRMISVLPQLTLKLEFQLQPAGWGGDGTPVSSCCTNSPEVPSLLLSQAVCCSDGEHCCPKGYRCNMAVQTCEKASGGSLPWLQKLPALQEEPSQAVSGPAQPAEVVCDKQTSCPRDTSCCFMQKTQKWGCCPVPNVGLTV